MSGVLKQFNFTEAWGLNAGTGQMTTLGAGASSFTEFITALGGRTISGVVTRSVESLDADGGARWTMDFADDRIRLTWDYVTALFNRVEITARHPSEPDPATDGGAPGPDDPPDDPAPDPPAPPDDPASTEAGGGTPDLTKPGRRYYHLYPDDWQAQKKTWTKKPLTVKEILQKVFGAKSIRGGGDAGGGISGGLGVGTAPMEGMNTESTLETPTLTGDANAEGSDPAGGSPWKWTFDFHEKLKEVVYDVDASNGMELGNFLQLLCDRVGLLVGLSGRKTLRFALKGEGPLPQLLGPNTKQLSFGDAISQNKTSVLVIGDRNLYQDINLELVPDWKRDYEQWIFEGALIAKIQELFFPGSGDDPPPELRAQWAVKARTVTVREFADKLAENGDAELDENGLNPMYDSARWAETIRTELPVWFYLNEIVFKSYRIPRDYQIFGLTLDMLELREGLLNEVTFSSGTGEIAYKDDGEIYPDMKALLVANGQPVNFYDPSRKEFVTPETYADLASKFTSIPNFKLDHKNKSVLFDEPVFVPADLYLWANAENDDVPTNHPSKYLVVPNEGATFSPATVRASFSFEAERYAKHFGQGKRRSTSYVPGLNRHVLLQDGEWKTEILYDTDPHESADEKAAKAVKPVIAKKGTYLSGSVERLGTAGTVLNGCLDRVTCTLDGRGLRETVEFTKEAPPNYFDSERELERRRQAEELFPGQRELNQDVRDLRHLAAVLAGQGDQSRTSTYRNLNDVPRKPMGNENPGTTLVWVDAGYDAGSVLWRNDEGKIGLEGNGFVGVVIPAGSQAAPHPTLIAGHGVVPVKVNGPFQCGDKLFCTDGDPTASVGGDPAGYIGTVTESWDKEGTMTVPVRLGTPSPEMPYPFKIVGLSSVDGFAFVGVVSGRVNATIPMDDPGDNHGAYPFPSECAWIWKVTDSDTIWLRAERVKCCIEGSSEPADDPDCEYDGNINPSSTVIYLGSRAPAESADTCYWTYPIGSFVVVPGVGGAPPTIGWPSEQNISHSLQMKWCKILEDLVGSV